MRPASGRQHRRPSRHRDDPIDLEPLGGHSVDGHGRPHQVAELVEADVSEQLRLASVTDGLLGDVRFDELGDLVRAPVTVYRMTAEGLEVDRVVTVP